MKGYSNYPKFQHHWNRTIILFRVISQTLVEGYLTPLQRCSRYILQPLSAEWAMTTKWIKKVPNLFQRLFFKVLKALQYFGHVWYNSASPDIFDEIMKMTKHAGLWNADLTWYSPITTYWKCLYTFEHGLRVLNILDLVKSLTFLQLADENVLNYLFTVPLSTVPSLFVQEIFFFLLSHL